MESALEKLLNGLLSSNTSNSNNSPYGFSIKSWPENQSLMVSSVPLNDKEKLKLWLACNIFLNQGIQEVSYKNEKGETVVIKSAKDAVKEAINNSFFAAGEFVKKI